MNVRSAAASLSLALLFFAAQAHAAIRDAQPYQSEVKPVALELKTADGVEVHGVRWGPGGGVRPLILLFHQAGSNLHEYDEIAPKLFDLGFTSIAIDQRAGGNFYPPSNVTVDRRGGNDPNFLDALADMDAALRYGAEMQGMSHPKRPLIVWGSSYSASLAFALVAEHQNEVSALLAFSPGEYFDDATYVHRYARRVNVPVFIDSAADAQEEAAATSIASVIPSKRVTLFTPPGGIHGSSTLNCSRDAQNAAANWVAVAGFLGSVGFASPSETEVFRRHRLTTDFNCPSTAAYASMQIDPSLQPLEQHASR